MAGSMRINTTRADEAAYYGALAAFFASRKNRRIMFAVMVYTLLTVGAVIFLIPTKAQ